MTDLPGTGSGGLGRRDRARRSVAVVADDGEVLRREDAVLPLYSVTKPYIAACVCAAGIDVDTPVSAWIDEALVPRARDITVRHLLNHTSGLRDYGALPEYRAAIAAGRIWSDDDFAEVTLRRELLFEPGTGWSYSNPGYWLLSRIVQQHCGLDLEACIRTLVLEPLDLRDTRLARGEFADDLPGYPAEWVWHGLLMSTAHDAVRFMRSDLAAALLDDTGVVPVPVEHPHWRAPAYGHGLMIDRGLRYGHNGDGPGYSAACFRFVRAGLTACLLCAADAEGEAERRLLSLPEMQPTRPRRAGS